MSKVRSLRQLQRDLRWARALRWTVSVLVAGGIALSVTINVLHAPNNIWAKVISSAPPIAVGVILELIAHIPSSARLLSAVRIVGAVAVAGGAGYLSYMQQYAAILSLGFPRDQAKVWPAVIDGMMVVVTVSLVEVVRRMRQLVDLIDERRETDPVARRSALDELEPPNVQAFRAAQRDLAAQHETLVPTARQPVA